MQRIEWLFCTGKPTPCERNLSIRINFGSLFFPRELFWNNLFRLKVGSLYEENNKVKKRPVNGGNYDGTINPMLEGENSLNNWVKGWIKMIDKGKEDSEKVKLIFILVSRF